MYHGPQKQRERPLPNAPVAWSHILSQARLRTLCTSVTVPIFPKPSPYHPTSLHCCILQHWVKIIPHKLYWEKQTWSSLGWGNWLQDFHFLCEYCRHFLLNSRQAAVKTVISATIKFSEDPVPGGMGTQVQRPIYGLQENQVAPLQTSEWDVMPTPALCSDYGAKHWTVMSVGSMQEYTVAWIIWRDALDLGRFSLSLFSDLNDHYHS